MEIPVVVVFLLLLLFAQGVQRPPWISRRESYNSSPECQRSKMSPHILQLPDFWKVFSAEVEKKKWKCSFPADVLHRELENDRKLYKNDSVLIERRKGAAQWLSNDNLWIRTILGACKEMAACKPGMYSSQLENLHLATALRDFVEHIHYFYTIAKAMEIRGEKVVVTAQNESMIHDIDKLDPVMLIGYSERFEDDKNTSLWNLCVGRHLDINPHHQQNALWTNPWQTNYKKMVLREMVCDKVSRRLQKNLNGEQSIEMWDADMIFYKGLPEPWLKKAADLQEAMKNWEITPHAMYKRQ